MKIPIEQGNLVSFLRLQNILDLADKECGFAQDGDYLVPLGVEGRHDVILSDLTFLHIQSKN